jgi:hypothetical protein
MNRKEVLFVSIGLLMVTTPTLINDWTPIPDFFRGVLAGLGIGLEIIGLILIVKRKKKQEGAY